MWCKTKLFYRVLSSNCLLIEMSVASALSSSVLNNNYETLRSRVSEICRRMRDLFMVLLVSAMISNLVCRSACCFRNEASAIFRVSLLNAWLLRLTTIHRRNRMKHGAWSSSMWCAQKDFERQYISSSRRTFSSRARCTGSNRNVRPRELTI